MAINLIDKIKPANNGKFPMVDAVDVEMPDGARLSDSIPTKLSELENDEDYLKDEEFERAFNGVIKPMANTVQLDTTLWDGDTEGHTNLVGMFYKISDSTEFPDTFMIELSCADTSTGMVSLIKGVGAPGVAEVYLNDKNTTYKFPFGVGTYSWKPTDDSSRCLVIVANQAGTLSSAVFKKITGINPGVSVQHEAGTYVFYQSTGDSSAEFVSKVVSCMNVKKYIDSKLGSAAMANVVDGEE